MSLPFSSFLQASKVVILALEPYTLAMLSIAHLTDRIEPIDRFCTGNYALDESYRAVVNTGIRAYQLHTYLAIVDQYLGPKKCA